MSPVRWHVFLSGNLCPIYPEGAKLPPAPVPNISFTTKTTSLCGHLNTFLAQPHRTNYSSVEQEYMYDQNKACVRSNMCAHTIYLVIPIACSAQLFCLAAFLPSHNLRDGACGHHLPRYSTWMGHPCGRHYSTIICCFCFDHKKCCW